MSRETLLAELNRLLDAGEPLLTLFPKKPAQLGWAFRFPELPDNISDEMEWYANEVALRAGGLIRRGFWQEEPTTRLAKRVKKLEAGLVGWRAIGVLK